MYIDKQALYESFISRGFDDACARLMAGLDPATVMEAKDPYEESAKKIRKKQEEILGDRNRKRKPYDDEITRLKKEIAVEYENLENIIDKYREEVGESDNQNGTDKSTTHENEDGYTTGSSDQKGSAGKKEDGSSGADTSGTDNQTGNAGDDDHGEHGNQNGADESSTTHEPEEGYTVDSSKTKGSDEHIKNIANNWGNYSKEEKEKITKSMSEDDRNNLVLALTDIERIGETHPEALESVNFLGETILPDEEWFNKNKNNDTSSKQENPEQKKPDEQSKEAQEGDKQKQQNAETQQANGSEEPTETKDSGGSKTGNETPNEHSEQRTEQAGEAEDDTGKKETGNSNETDNSTTSEPEADYDAGSPNREGGSVERSPKKDSKSGEEKEVFPPLDHKIGDGRTVGDLVLEIRKNTYELLKNAIMASKIDSDGLFRMRHVGLVQDGATKEAIETERKNFGRPSDRVIYDVIFGDDGLGVKLDVFTIDEYKNIQ